MLKITLSLFKSMLQWLAIVILIYNFIITLVSTHVPHSILLEKSCNFLCNENLHMTKHGILCGIHMQVYMTPVIYTDGMRLYP